MTARRFRRSSLAASVGAAVLAMAAGQAFGAAFALQESSGSGVGNAFAGGAASAEDASTVWANPAGMARLSTMQLVMGLDIVTPSFKFKNDQSLPAFNQPLGGTGGNAGSTNYVPDFYFVVPINKQWSFGVGVNAPFGLVTEYDSDWLGRFQAVKSDIKTINVNPAISWKPVDNLAVGVGVNWQQAKLTFTQKANYSAGLAQAAGTAAAAGLIPPSLIPQIVGVTPGLESDVNITADDSAWGWNIGALWDVTPSTRIGAQYRSAIKYTANGTVSICNPATAGSANVCGQTMPAVPPALAPVVGLLATNVNAALAGSGVTANIKLPDTVNLSIFSKLDDRWDVMGDAQWTQWSTIQQLAFVRTNDSPTLQPLPPLELNFRDTWRVSAGANYHYSDAWLFRGGVAWDQTPTNNTNRDPRLPDNDRFWLSIGAQYKVNQNWKFDGGFTYIFIDSPSINQNSGNTAQFGLINGSYDASVTIFGLQATYTF